MNFLGRGQRRHHPTTHSEREHFHAPRENVTTLALGALGVVFGDIGTSPLYAIDQVFFGSVGADRTPENVLGAISLAIWTIIVIVAIKYALLVLRADNDGEGGVFALYGLLHPFKNERKRILLWSLMLGAGLLLGDGMITPAISVLSAVEGLEVATPAFSPYVVPITVILLTALFAVQFRGTAGIGAFFGPLLLVWFVTIAALGLVAIAQQPGILAAFDPSYGAGFLMRAGPYRSLLILSAMMLVVTGGEAMYADLGHFGARPIRIGWFAVVFPALLLNYLGQGAYLLGEAPVEGGKLFYNLAPQPCCAARRAGDARNRRRLPGADLGGLFPRLPGCRPRPVSPAYRAPHPSGAFRTNLHSIRQLGAVRGLRRAGSRLSVGHRTRCGLWARGGGRHADYVRGHVRRRAALLGLGKIQTTLVWGALLVVNGALLVASSLKFLEGGFIPLGIGIASFLVMATWRWGRKATFAAYEARSTLTMADVVELHAAGSSFIERNALVLAPTQVRHLTDRAPTLVELLWDRYGIFPRNLILVEVIHPKIPYVHEDRYRVIVFDRDDRTRQRHQRSAAFRLHGGAERRTLPRGSGAAS